MSSAARALSYWPLAANSTARLLYGSGRSGWSSVSLVNTVMASVVLPCSVRTTPLTKRICMSRGCLSRTASILAIASAGCPARSNFVTSARSSASATGLDDNAHTLEAATRICLILFSGGTVLRKQGVGIVIIRIAVRKKMPWYTVPVGPGGVKTAGLQVCRCSFWRSCSRPQLGHCRQDPATEFQQC